MSLTLNFEKQFTQTSERVKSVDLHPTEPWVLVSLYTGHVCIWNYQSQTMVTSIKVAECPVRSAKFVARKNWIITGADDKFIRVFNYDTSEKIKEFEAHSDYIRCVAVHPEFLIVVSASDDQMIKSWNWESDWSCNQIFQGHSHYVMGLAFDPNDYSALASASLDGSIKVWKMNSPTPIFTLDGHTKGVNCVEFFTVSNKPYIVSGSDDFTVKVWDYETKVCIQTLEAHTNNVTSVCVHPDFPIIITTAEDGNIHVWHATTFGLEKTLNYALGRVWNVGCTKGSNKIVFGCDNGTLVISVDCSN